MDALSSRWGNAMRSLPAVILWLVVLLISTEFLLAVYGKYHLMAGPAYERFVDRHGWLWLHLAGGGVAIALGPAQFLARWWYRRPALHRRLGYVYFGGVLVASAAAAGLIATTPAPLSIRLGFASTALAWLTTAWWAMRSIHRGQVQRHRAWMIRSYAVTLAPVVFRLMLPLAIASGVSPSAALISGLLWSSWLIPLGCVQLFGTRLGARIR
ncbi:DUF2306 domain-containing protein [Stenotrophomonas sp. PD6]|uniref:DUF2306 domain-containing protein n=1 Tax=Stenotrophomonas sp. PD6 TaxID=3368612 RepID=UPI003BA2A6C6